MPDEQLSNPWIHLAETNCYASQYLPLVNKTYPEPGLYSHYTYLLLSPDPIHTRLSSRIAPHSFSPCSRLCGVTLPVICPAGSTRVRLLSRPLVTGVAVLFFLIGYTPSDKAFLFSLRNRDGQGYRMAVKQGKERYASYGVYTEAPWFGDGKDLYIAHNCHTNTDSHSNLGSTYGLPADYAYGTPQAQSLLAGSFHFKCDEYEVFYRQ